MLALQTGLLDALPLTAVAAFRAALPAMLGKDAAETLSAIDKTGELDPTMRETLMAALTRFAASLSDDNAVVPKDAAAPASP